MEDSKKILPDGTAMPYFSVFNGKGKPIIDPKNKLPIGMNISNWWYEYNEEEADKAEFTIETDNPDLVDHYDLREKASVILQWGWIYPDGSSVSSPRRIVTIRDTDVDFGDGGTKLTVVCSDNFESTKTMPANMKDKAFWAWVKENVQGKFALEIIDHTTRTELHIKPKEKPKTVKK